MTLKAPVYTDPFPVDLFAVTFKKEDESVVLVDILVDMPWYFSWLDYNLRKTD